MGDEAEVMAGFFIVLENTNPKKERRHQNYFRLR